MNKISLEQWRMFVAVVDKGGFAQAGETLYKSQSAISHAIRKLEDSVGKPLFNIVGRKAIMTPFAESLLPNARALLTSADQLEHDAISTKQVVSKTIAIAVDTLYPKHKFYQKITAFSHEHANVNLQIFETVLSRAGELLEDGRVDIGIASRIPKGFITQTVGDIELVLCASHQHPLAKADQIDYQTLAQYRQIVIRDSGVRSNTNSGWLGATNRTTVSSLNEALHAVQHNCGYCWFPKWLIEQMPPHQIVRLPLDQGAERTVSLFIGADEKCLKDTLSQSLIERLRAC